MRGADNVGQACTQIHDRVHTVELDAVNWPGESFVVVTWVSAVSASNRLSEQSGQGQANSGMRVLETVTVEYRLIPTNRFLHPYRKSFLRKNKKGSKRNCLASKKTRT